MTRIKRTRISANGEIPTSANEKKVDKTPRYTLGREERLKKRKYIEELFNSGESFSIYPLRVYFFIRPNTGVREAADNSTKNTSEPQLQFGVGASKKNFKKSVDRNRIKRLVREAYRLQHSSLKLAIAEKKNCSLKLFILYTGKELPDYSLVKEKVTKALDLLATKLK